MEVDHLFVVCFRSANTCADKPPFPAWAYRPSYLPVGLAVEIGEGSPLSEPMWFFLSFVGRPDRYLQHRRQPLLHKVGLREITAVRLSPLSPEDLSLPAQAAIRSGCVLPGQVSSCLLELDFDGVKQGKMHDFRPTLPLVFRW